MKSLAGAKLEVRFPESFRESVYPGVRFRARRARFSIDSLIDWTKSLVYQKFEVHFPKSDGVMCVPWRCYFAHAGFSNRKIVLLTGRKGEDVR